MTKMKMHLFTKRPIENIPLSINKLLSLGKSRYIHAISAVVLPSNFQLIPVKKVAIEVNDDVKNGKMRNICHIRHICFS